MPVDEIDGKNLVGTIAYTGLKSRLQLAWDIGLARLPEGFKRQLQNVGEFPVEAYAVGQVVPIGGAIPQPAAVEI